MAFPWLPPLLNLMRPHKTELMNLSTEHPWRARSVSHQDLWLVSDQKNAEVSGIQRPLPILDPSLTLPL